MSSDESHQSQESHEPADDNDLARPVDPPTLMGRITSGERHLTRRVIAPVALLVVAIPVVALLLFNLRAVSGDASTPASARTDASSTAAPSPNTPSATPSPSTSPSASATPTTAPTTTTPSPTTVAPTPTPTASGPSITSVTPTTGPAAGGTVLVVRGADLGPVTQVLFGALNGANLQHVSDTELRVTAPAGARGSVPLVFKAGADLARSPVTRFTYS